MRNQAPFCICKVMNERDYLSDKRYKRVRRVALTRDKYLCQNCKRYGRKTAATITHHIWQAEYYPEYKYKVWNLISLCSACHNKMHVRNTHELTEEGERLKQRTRPPCNSFF